jgi:NAD-dependent dihydropyrimidine dehydrogenase PreA subunit
VLFKRGIKTMRYLNSQSRRDAIVIMGLIEELRDIITRWHDNMKQPPKEVLGYLGASMRFSARAIKELDTELDNNEIERLEKMAKTIGFDITYMRYDYSSKDPQRRTYDITEDERDNLVEALAEVRCVGCNGCVKDCTVRSQFFKWDVTPIYDVTDDTHPCQYMTPEE